MLCAHELKQYAVNKRGRPISLMEGKGINVTEEIKQIFRVAIRKYYYTSAQHSIKLTYQLILKKFFADIIRYENGVKMPIIKLFGDIPYLNRFTICLWNKMTRAFINEIREIKKYHILHIFITGIFNDSIMMADYVDEYDDTKVFTTVRMICFLSLLFEIMILL